jgi:hypothetical protein
MITAVDRQAHVRIRAMSFSDVSNAAVAITETVEAEGVLLVHDQLLPSVTALIAGEPVLGSWWSHPLANLIYDALGAVEDRFATCKLIARKLTLVAPRLWSDLAAIGSAKWDWQLDRLSEAEMGVLDRVESVSVPVVLDKPELRSAGRRLEERLLVASEEAHTAAGYHLKALLAWPVWMKDHGAPDSPLPDPETAMARFEEVVQHWGATRRLFPWPTPTTPP